MNKLICNVYKSPKKKLTYLYVERATDLQRVPPKLLDSFGKPEWVLGLTLEPERRLALVEAAEVISQIEQQGYYLQLPPPTDHAVTEWLRSGQVK